jgi:predicted DsbA family dithiol-disulfide isomerase
MAPHAAHDHDEHEGHDHEGHAHGEDTRIRVLHGASPACHWSFGYQPVLERLRLVYGDQIVINTYQIPVYESFDQWMQDYGLDAASLQEWMAEIRGLIRLPVSAAYQAHPIRDCTPITMALQAAECARPGAGDRVARWAWFAISVEGRDLNAPDAGLKLAERAGVPRKEVEAALADGRAEARLREDAQSMHALGLNFFALQVRDFEGRTVTLEHAFDAAKIEEAVEWLSRGKVRKQALPSLAGYAQEHAPVSLRELQEVFRADEAKVRAALDPLTRAGALREQRFDGHAFWLPAR